MPSRKKAQGQARKAKRAAEAHGDGMKKCDHLSHTGNWSQDSWDVAKNLVEEFESMYYDIMSVDEEDCDNYTCGIVNLADHTCDKYSQFNDEKKELFRKIILAEGTQACLDAANESDLAKADLIPGAFRYYILIHTLEVRDMNGHPNALDDVIRSPRQSVRYFHRRNSCDCLQEIYYKLKETTKRIAVCCNCKIIKDIREMSECEYCQMANFCSYDCALAQWTEHKEECKLYRKCQKSGEWNDFSDAIGPVKEMIIKYNNSR